MAVSSNADVFAACLPLHSKAKLWRASNGRYMEKDAREEQGTRLAGSKKKKKIRERKLHENPSANEQDHLFIKANRFSKQML